MFIREKPKTIKGKKYTQHQLIESVRTPLGPRQQIVYNFGYLNLEKEKWKELANRIESKLCNQSHLFVSTKEIEKLAEHYVQLIIKNRLSAEAQKDEILEDGEKSSPRYESVDINSCASSDARTIGAEHVVLSQISEYRFDKILGPLGFTDKQISYAKMLISSRLVHPASERETSRWLRESSGLLELLQKDMQVYDNALHRTASMLWKNHESIEKSLSGSARELFSLKENLILYDLTNTYFSGSKRGSQIAKHGGNSKEKRNDRPLVTLALTVDEEGFPKQSKILDGNVSEPETLINVLDELAKNNSLFDSRKTIVIDAGIATEENLKFVREKGFYYVAVSRKKSFENDFWTHANEKEIMLANGKDRLKINLTRTEEEAFLLCHSNAKEIKEEAIVQGKLNKFREALNQLKDGLQKKNTQKSYGKIMERIGRLKEKYKVGNLYDIKVSSKKNIVTNITFKENPKGNAKENRYGKYVLRTNRLDLTDEEISKTHRSLTTIEDSFKSMKSYVGIRPNFHKNDFMTTAHIFITVIAYHILAAILKKLKDGGKNYSWNTVRNKLSSHVRVTSTFNTELGKTVHLRTSTIPTMEQQEIYKELNIKQHPLKHIKTITQLKN